jgi:hypothetical protein
MGPKKSSNSTAGDNNMSDGAAKRHELQLQMEEVEMAQIQEGKVGVSIQYIYVYIYFFSRFNIFVSPF